MEARGAGVGDDHADALAVVRVGELNLAAAVARAGAQITVELRF